MTVTFTDSNGLGISTYYMRNEDSQPLKSVKVTNVIGISFGGNPHRRG